MGVAAAFEKNHRALWAATLGMFLDGFDLSILAIALLPLTSQWQPSPADVGTLMAMALLGSLVGGVLGGWVTDRFGRQRLLLPNVALYLLGALISAVSPDLEILLLGRFVTGLAIGLDYPLVATIVAEYSATARRGRGFAWVNLAWFAGAIFSTLLGLALLPLGADSWRWMLASAVLPALALLWLRRRLPESPRWLLRRGQVEAAASALRRLEPGLDAGALRARLAEFGCERMPLTPLWQRQVWRRRLILGILPWFCLDVVSLGIALYLPSVLRRTEVASSDTAAAAINLLFELVTALAIVYILPRVDRIGRIPLQKRGFALMALGLVLFALGVAMPSVVVLFAGSTLYALGLGLGPAVTIFALAVEIFPTEWRASIAGLATSVSRLGAVFSAVLFPVLEQGVGIAVLLLGIAAVAWLGRATTARFAVESGARSLEALEREARETPSPEP